jgi:uroporphyrinogen-III decarboxylase
MDRRFYLDLAARGLRMPIGTDLVLHEESDPGQAMRDGERLGRVVELAARRYDTPLAFPLMDLKLEKADLLALLGVAEAEADTFHFREAPEERAVAQVAGACDAAFGKRGQAHIDAVRYIAERTGLIPIGMCIGPFSLMTKLMADPITAVAMAGAGMTAAEDPDVLTAERCLALAESAVSRSAAAQARAGARAMLICEPAANIVFLSPKQIQTGSDIFERFVMQPNLRLKRQLADAGVDLIFHDCGELSDFMVRQFAERLDPVILSFGSSRKLWEDAALVPDHIVLFGNLPTKSFYSDSTMPVVKVQSMTRELIANMRATGHPHILGSECDVLHVAEAAETIRRKVRAMLAA